MSAFLISVPKETAQTSGHSGIREKPFGQLTSLSFTELKTTRQVPAAQRRLLTEQFVATFQWEALRPRISPAVHARQG